MDKNESDSTPAELPEQLRRLMQMLQVDAANRALRRRCVEMAVQSARYDVILQIAEAALAVDPADPTALFDKATGLMGQREYKLALAALERTASLAGPDAAIRLNQALCHYCLQEFERAKFYLDECYRGGMRTTDLLRLLVSSCHHLGLMEEAVKIAAQNEQAGTADAALAGVYALLYLDAGDAMRASQWARSALRADPRSIDGRIVEATLLTARMQKPQAQKMLQSVLDDAPTTGRAWIGLGTLALLDNDLHEAKRRLARGVELMPGHVGSWHVLGWAQLVSGELDAAERTFQRALESDRNFAETHGALAAVAAIRGEKQRARHGIEVALRLDTGSLAARYAEAVLASQSGNERQGQKILADAVAGLTAQDSSALSRMLLNIKKKS